MLYYTPMPSSQKISSKIELVTINNPGTPNILEWFNVVNAGKNEIEFLRKKFNFDFQHLKASSALSSSQRPLLSNAGDYIFLILHFPTLNNGAIHINEIEFFIGHGYMVTIHNNNLPSLNNLFSLAKKNPESLYSYHLDSSAILLSEILDRLIQSTYEILDQNGKAIDSVEELIFSDDRNSAIGDILQLRHNLINIRKIMQNHKNILKKLKEVESSIVPDKEVKDRYADLIEHSIRIWETLENQREMTEVLNATNESLINRQLNYIMKTLTVISVITFPLTLLAAIFGMNARHMPFVEGPYGFYIIISLMTLLSFFMLIFFYRKNWLK